MLTVLFISLWFHFDDEIYFSKWSLLFQQECVSCNLWDYLYFGIGNGHGQRLTLSPNGVVTNFHTIQLSHTQLITHLCDIKWKSNDYLLQGLVVLEDMKFLVIDDKQKRRAMIYKYMFLFVALWCHNFNLIYIPFGNLVNVLSAVTSIGSRFIHIHVSSDYVKLQWLNLWLHFLTVTIWMYPLVIGANNTTHAPLLMNKCVWSITKHVNGLYFNTA